MEKVISKVLVNEQALRRLKSGYPWVYRTDLKQPNLKDFEAGALVDFVGDKGMFAARGYLHPKNTIAGRSLTRYDHEKIDHDFWKKRVTAALEKRQQSYKEDFYRLIHAESDGFPGLIVDRYDNVLVAQINTAGMEKLYPDVEKAIVEVVKPRSIILRNDSEVRKMEGLDGYNGVSFGDTDVGVVTIRENGAKFAVDLIDGQKTGWFFDQRDNRLDVAMLAKGKTMIDVFCHTGGFGITALVGGAKSVTFVDSSGEALEITKHNAELNKVEKSSEYIEGKAFTVLEKLASEGKKYQVVCVDPPAFIKSRHDIATGLRGYQKLAKLAAPLVEEGGVLFFASCSHHAGIKDLIKQVSEGIKKSGRAFELVKTGGAGADHPVHPMLSETGYLKSLTFKLD